MIQEIRKLLKPFSYALSLMYLFETPPGSALVCYIFFLFCINDFICVSYCLYHKDLIKIIKKKKKNAY